MKLTNENINDYISMSFIPTPYGTSLLLHIKGSEKTYNTGTYDYEIKKALKTTDLNKIRLGLTKSERIYIYSEDKYGFMKGIKYVYSWIMFIEEEINNSLGEDPREDFLFLIPSRIFSYWDYFVKVPG